MIRIWLTIVVCSLILTACGRILTPEKAIQRGDVVAEYGVVGNLFKMDEFYNGFYNGFQSGKGNKIRITRFTKEGDPIFLNLTSKQGKVLLKNDSSKDKNGSNITTYTCETLSKSREQDSTLYQLLNCQRTDMDDRSNIQNIEILSVPDAP